MWWTVRRSFGLRQSIVSDLLVILYEHLVCKWDTVRYSRNHHNHHLINPCHDHLFTAAMHTSSIADNSIVICVQTIFAYALPHSMSTTLVGAYAVETSISFKNMLRKLVRIVSFSHTRTFWINIHYIGVSNMFLKFLTSITLPLLVSWCMLIRLRFCSLWICVRCIQYA